MVRADGCTVGPLSFQIFVYILGLLYHVLTRMTKEHLSSAKNPAIEPDDLASQIARSIRGQVD